ncbi:tyrosine-type recombinase/integrase [Planomonospora sp. ID67723]|uniref:tyrosine-type recombinase/integrase n=1 Tax=Planomonospora sp. ID67723 TaxID=2738134 RepID=UPI0018C3D5F3|nr:tyrosine-type recombinase/integrase [Planomonospora sp. ID67723]MBG0830556.1 tyrosine-type recombinase/integrase [Planomonospora sp. ID67723]
MPEPSNVVPLASRRRARPASAAPDGIPLIDLIESWRRALEAANRSPETIRVYMRTARMLAAFLEDSGLPADAEGVQAEHVREFLVSEIRRRSASTAYAHHGNLGSFFTWLIAEGERTGPSPVVKADKPSLPKKIKKTVSDDTVQALLANFKGNDFQARRNTAIIRLVYDSGVRVGGLASMLRADLDLSERTVKIVLKGGDEHLVPFGKKTAAALDRYLRVRGGHPHADSAWLWIGEQGRLTQSGIRSMLSRGAEQAGTEHVTPHQFRRKFAHEYLKAGGSERGAMLVAGWQSRAMLDHYSEELAAERAREEHARLSPGDRI